MPRRGFGLDLAYVDWKWNSKARTWLGRTPNPFWTPGKNQMIFDSDLVFEGLALKAEAQWAPLRLQLNLGSSMISENYDSNARVDVVDTGIAGGQIVANIKTELGDLSFHYSHIEFVNIQDKNITNIDVNAKIDTYSNPFNRFKGNSVDRPDPLVANYFYHNKFVLISTGGEWKWSVGDYEILAFYDFVDNYQASRVSSAIEKGGAFRWGRSQIQYAQISKEAESVIGAFTDSDSNGGGTDNQGQRITYLYQFSEHSQVAYSLFEAQRGRDTVRRDFIASNLDFIVWF